MSNLPLILASSSPRRRQLLSEAGYVFTVVPPSDAAENVSEAEAGLPAKELVAKLAVQKAGDVARRTERGIVIACDTVAESQGQILGKPAERDVARRMLKVLRGQEHRVYSGLCLWRRPDDEQRLQIEVTKLVMDPISDEQLEQYLDSGQWEGKAGAFGYQDGLDWVHIVEGSESNVVGLPMERLQKMLAGFGRAA
jgi:nucleoside triphosphate pyrophosphatase